MNIFATSPDPIESAQALDDIRVHKMLSESAQLLSTAVRYMMKGLETDIKGTFKTWSNERDPFDIEKSIMLLPTLGEYVDQEGFAHIHICRNAYDNHPCNVWARANPSHFRWLTSHALALANEFHTARDKTHGSLPVITRVQNIYINGFMTWPQAVVDSEKPYYFTDCSAFKEEKSDVHDKYRKTLLDKWKHDKIRLSWKNRSYPKWASGYLDERLAHY